MHPIRLSLLVLVCAAPCAAQDYPTKPVRIMTGPVGGANDFSSRIVAQAISGSLGQPVIVDNRAAQISIETVAKAPPDGATLLSTGSIFWVGPLMRSQSYDPLRDFATISLLGTQPNLLVVHPTVPAKSVRELITLVKARPGELNFSAGATGSSTHLAAELFKAMAKVDIVRIAYKGGGPALNDLLSGQVQLMFATPASVSSQVKSGRLRALAVTTARPSALLPGVPTVADSGVPGYESASRQGLFAPAGTPSAIVARLNREIALVLAQPQVKEKFASSSVEAVHSTPEQLTAIIKSEMGRLGKVIMEAGIREE